ncbi:unnamed protein product, partial [marine sediment metagenome]
MGRPRKEPKEVIEDLAEVTGKDIKVYPDRIELTEVQIGVDLTKDGNTPMAMVFECDREMPVDVVVEFPNGTRG